jgi:hypothetical protein
VQQAIATCKQAIQAQSALPSASKSKLEAICAKAAKGDAAAVRKAAQEVCAEIANGSAVGSGPAREAVVAACKKAK